MKKRIIATAVAGLMLGAVAPSQAGSIKFDPDGPGVAFGPGLINTFDWLPGNFLAKNSVPTTALGSFLGQAKLGAFGGSTVSPTLGGTAEFTFQFSVPVLTTSASLGSIQTLTLTPIPGTPSFFTMYYDTNPLTFSNDQVSHNGTGFGDGIAIMTGVINFFPSSGVTTAPDIGSLTADNTHYEDLDQFNLDQTGGIQSLKVAGSAGFSIDVTSFNPAWFLTDISTVQMDLAFSSSTVVPFSQVEPAVNNGVTELAAVGGGVVGNTPNFGADGKNDFLCGGGAAKCDFLFQGDGSNTFQASAAPEPTTLAILGLGLLGLGAMRRRSRQRG